MNIRLQALLAVLLLAACSTAASGEVADRFRQVSDAVVVIGAQQTMLLAGSRGLQQASSGNIGSGVLISSDGKIMTAAHLVQSANEIKVKFQGGQVIDAHVVASVPLADVALLQLEHVPKDAVVARLGDSNRASIGDPVFVVGAPYGIAHSLTVGHLSARHRQNMVMGGFETGSFFKPMRP